jgi:hypothetical protein
MTALLMFYVRTKFENKFGMKKGEHYPHTPLQAFCGAKRIKRRALVHWGEWCSARLPSSFDYGRIKFVYGCNVYQHG